MDPFEEVMTTMRVASSLYVRLQLHAPYGVRFDARLSARLVVITRGATWLVADALPRPAPLAAGDCLIVKADSFFSLQDELGRKLVPCDRILSKITGRTVVHGGDGVLTELISGALSFDAAAAEPLTALMPPIVHVRLDEEQAHLVQTTLQLMGLETAQEGLGAGLVLGRLADVLFVQAMRVWCNTDEQARGWLAGLKNDRLAAAIRAVHGDVSRPWTVEMLAREAGLSRSAFAQFSRLEAKVSREEALGEAYARLDDRDPAAEELERQFEDAERKERLERELRELKDKLKDGASS